MNCFSPKTFLKNMKQCAYISNLNQFLSMEKLNFDSDVTEMQNRFITHSCLKLQKTIPTACSGRNIYFYSHLFISYCQRLDLHEGSPEHVGLVLFLRVPARVDDGGVGSAPLHRFLHGLRGQLLHVVTQVQRVSQFFRSLGVGLWRGAHRTGTLTVGRVIT